MRPTWPTRILAAAVALVASLAGARPPDVLSPLIVQPIASPDPVVGADGRIHLAYELLLVNLTPSPVTIDSVEALNPVLDGTAVERLGNTGNTDGPHLHFHVMDGPSPLRSNGLPYVFTSFVGSTRR
jgi:hypothetical protein